MEKPIGDIFEFEGMKCIVEERSDSIFDDVIWCKECIFYGNDTPCISLKRKQIAGECLRVIRKDETPVRFALWKPATNIEIV